MLLREVELTRSRAFLGIERFENKNLEIVEMAAVLSTDRVHSC